MRNWLNDISAGSILRIARGSKRLNPLLVDSFPKDGDKQLQFLVSGHFSFKTEEIRFHSLR